MSIQCLNFAINFDGNITTTEKFILVILANYCDEQHSCFPSQKHIAKLCNLKTTKSVKTAIKKFQDLGIIKVVKRKDENSIYLSNKYFLNIKQPSNLQELNPSSPRNSNTKVDTKDIYTPQFEYFWKLYPRKVSKKKAWSIFKKIPERDWTNIIEAVRHLMKQNIETKFIPHPSTWLNQERYNDPIEEEKNNSLNNLAG